MAHHHIQQGPTFYCLFGAQGSGKGEQGKRLVKTLEQRGYRPTRLVSSEILERLGDSEIAATKDSGKPVCCDIVMPAFRREVEQAIHAGKDAIVVDGLPRYTEKQADGFAAAVADTRGSCYVVRIRAARDLCERRIVQRAQEDIAAGRTPRADDLNPEAVHERLEKFFATEMRMLRRLNIFHRFRVVPTTASDERSADEVHADLVRQVWGIPSHMDEADFGLPVGAGFLMVA
jgi:adenylate kinase family enzyme